MRLSSLWLVATALACAPFAEASDCYESQIKAPAPFKGNNDEIVVLTDGSVWQVKYEYEYMYEYYPSVVICPSSGKLIVNGKSLNVVPISSGRAPVAKDSDSPRRSTSSPQVITVVLKKPGCGDYFIADGPRGLYLLEWYGGHDPDVGDVIAGELESYGCKDVYYTTPGASGRIWVDDYLLSKSSALEKYAEKCH